MDGERHAVLIGNASFPKEPKLQDLVCPEKDVDALDAVLKDPERGAFKQPLVLKNRPHHEVLRVVNEVLRKAEKSDLVLIYYSGHGKLDPAGRLHLATVDTEVDALESTSIPVQSIRNYIDISPSTKVALVLDCCYSGAIGKEFLRGNVDDELNLISGGRGTFVMTASTGVQTAKEREAEGHGVFTKHFVDGIRQGTADRDGDGMITLSELYRHVHDNVLDESHQEPMKWDLNVRGELIVAKSGRSSREERRQALREVLLDLAEKGEIGDSVLSQALPIIAKAPKGMSESELQYDATLDMVLKPGFKVGDFVDSWHRIALNEALARQIERAAAGGHSTAKLEVVEPAKAPKQAERLPPKQHPKPQSPRQEPSPSASLTSGTVFRDIDEPWCPKMVVIPAGRFLMGSAEGKGDDDEHPQHEVVFAQPFALGRFPVTFKEYDHFCEQTGREKAGDRKWGRGRRPVINVSWEDAQAYCKWLSEITEQSYRLPTEAEWEYGCRAGTTTAYAFGDKITEKQANFERNVGNTNEVGSYPANDWELHDMHGNVWEWVEDCWNDSYASAPADGTAWLQGHRSERVLRGGSWGSLPEYLRSAIRSRYQPVVRGYLIGFRVARTLTP